MKHLQVNKVQTSPLRALSILILICALLPTNLAFAETGVEADSGGPYAYGRASRDGIGKFYMGREISHVMGHLGAEWLERSGRRREERTDRLVARLPLEPDSVVADIGAGTGYFSFRIAERVPQGKVLAVDIQQEMLDMIDNRMQQDQVHNIEMILGTERNPRLAESSVDVVLLVDAYHEFSWPREMAEGMFRALKPGGRLVLVEYRGEEPNIPIKRLHKMTERQARKEMEAVGLKWERTGDFLPQQHFMVFQRPLDQAGPSSMGSE